MAGNSSSFVVQNADALTDAIVKVGLARAESTMRKAAATGATVFKNEIVRRTPKVTGQLAAGCTVAFVPEESVAGELSTYLVTFVGVYPDKINGKKGMRRKDVANWIERGTSKMAPNPFIRPAYEGRKAAAAAAVDAVIQQSIPT